MTNSATAIAGRRLAVAMTSELAGRLARHLDRPDGQEGLCFLLWQPSAGATRTTAVLTDAVWPQADEQLVHGNVSFTSAYFLRAAQQAAEAGAGLALVHSHPGGRGWQTLSSDDHAAEAGHAAQTAVLTGLPLVGLTLATRDGAYSARAWQRAGRRGYTPAWCESVRVIGDRIHVCWNDTLRPPPGFRPIQARTISAWGQAVQADLARLHVGVVGAGSVGALVAEALARVGVERITLLDFDTVELVNLDRLLHASPRDARLGRAKIEVLARALRRSATATHPQITAIEHSVVEAEGLAVALDCDVLFSCVDRPWPRAVLNLAAYAHLIPVVDGGILIDANAAGADRRMRGAEWRAHLAAPGRACLECLGQYDPALVQLERDGRLDDPSYLTDLPDNHPLRRNQNVFPFSAATAAAEVLQLLAAVVAPAGIADTGAHLYHFTTGTLDRITEGCAPDCPYGTWLLTRGDAHALTVTGPHTAAQAARASRAHAHRRWRNRLSRALDDLLWRLL
jgi:hypothetical protein